MKLRIAGLTVLVMVFAAAPSFAQLPVGVKIGASFNKLVVPSGESDTENLTGLVGGISFQVAGNKMVSIVPEVLFHMRGTKFTGEANSFKLNYIELPVLLQFNVPANAISPFVNVGPTFGILVSASTKEDLGGLDLKDQFKKADVGVAVGGGVRVAKGVSLEFRFQQSLSGILSTDGATNFGETGAVKNRSMMILVGFGH
jgi:Outer membrane protein beta-barrel domain